MGAGQRIDEADRFSIDGLEFVPSWDRPSQPGSLTLLKGAWMVPLYEELLRDFDQPRMVELGISQGGSVALLGLLARPRRFVAVELSPTPIEPLRAALADRGLGDAVRPYYGVDQADQVRLTEILDDEFGPEPLDLVVDDASHRYPQTVASFEVLFSRLRPGGLYVIEDWTHFDMIAERVRLIAEDPASGLHDQLLARIEDLPEAPAPETPLSRLAAELVMAVAQGRGVVADVRIDENWIVARRGDTAIDPATFRFTDLYGNFFGTLAPTDATRADGPTAP